MILVASYLIFQHYFTYKKMQFIKSILGIPFLIVFLITTISAQKNYTQTVKLLKQQIQKPEFKSAAYNRLAYITDTYGTRMFGSTSLEQVIYQMASMASKQDFDNVHLEPVKNFTKWVRGRQSLTLFSPRQIQTKLNIIGLGGSVNGTVKGEVIVFKSFQELEKSKQKIKGKIVCYNNEWVDYPTTVQYRVDGASRAAKYGAIGTLVRSVTPQSISSVHTGYMEYDQSYPKIPVGAITVQDAQMFDRMQKRGQTIIVQLTLQSQFVSNCNSNNLIFQIKGSQKPEQIILAGGHIDTWDTGSQTGANDDGGGFITVFQSFRMLKRLNLRPKRTLRFIAWSGEESNSNRDGAAQYLQRHINQIDKHVAAFQDDGGSTKFLGIGHVGEGEQVVRKVLTEYLSVLGASEYSTDGYSVDVEPLYQKGVPIINNYVQDSQDFKFYYKYHHSAGDSMTIMSAADLDSNVVGIASFLYIIADLQVSLRQVKM